ncbi:MAG: AAA family ATPase [Opitutaceae bacterium]
MSDKDDTRNPMEEFQKQVEDLFKKGNFNSLFSQSPPERPGSTPPKPPPTPEEQPGDNRGEILEKIRSFNLKPREIRDYLNRFVIRQDEAKKVISVAICDHFNHVRLCLEQPELREMEHAKQNILLLGPTGVGKTYLLRCIARLIGVPFVKADATKFSETGYVGGDVDDLVRDLVKAANGDVELAQYGIVYIDEIDKIAGQISAGGRDVSGRGVQINLLKLLEETDVNLHSQTDILGQMQAVLEMQRGGKSRPRTLNTRHILFIVSGAFDKLGEQVSKRLKNSQVGFAASKKTDPVLDEEPLSRVETTDFIDYGFEPEFIGRLPVRVACHHLGADDLEDILLQSEGSVLKQYQTEFAGYGVTFSLKPDAVKAIAGMAHQQKTGARGLMTVLEQVFRDFKFELPSTSIREFEVSRDTIEHPGDHLKAMLKENEVAQRELLAGEVRVFADRFAEDAFCILRAEAPARMRSRLMVAESLATDTTSIRALRSEIPRFPLRSSASLPETPARRLHHLLQGRRESQGTVLAGSPTVSRDSKPTPEDEPVPDPIADVDVATALCRGAQSWSTRRRPPSAVRAGTDSGVEATLDPAESLLLLRFSFDHLRQHNRHA